MIPNITSAEDAGNVLGYDFGDKKNKYQKIHVLASEGVDIDEQLLSRVNMNWTDGNRKEYQAFRKAARKLADNLNKQFLKQSSLSERIVKTTGHISISYCPVDFDRLDNVEDETYEQLLKDEKDRRIQDVYYMALVAHMSLREVIAREFMIRMDIEDTQWVLTSHLGTRCPHDHLAYNRVNYAGMGIDSGNERRRAQKIAKELRAKFKLTPPGKIPRMIPSLLDGILGHVKTIEEFRDACWNVGLVFHTHKHIKDSDIARYGISYEYNGKVVPGYKLGKKYTIGSVLDAIHDNKRKYNKAKGVIAAYNSVIIPIVGKLNQLKNDSFKLYGAIIKSEVRVGKKTSELFDAIRESWQEVRNYTDQFKNIRSNVEAAKMIAEIIMLLNPIIGMTVKFLSRIVGDVQQSELLAKKRYILGKVDELRTQIKELEEKRSQIAVEEQSKLKKGLEIKERYNEYHDDLRALDDALTAARGQMLAEERKVDMGEREPARIAPKEAGIVHVTLDNYKAMAAQYGFTVEDSGSKPVVIGCWSQEIPEGGLYLTFDQSKGEWRPRSNKAAAERDLTRSKRNHSPVKGHGGPRL